ncbi:MAG: hypothetical protein ACUVTL_01205 [Thermoproteota archaeon]
MLRHSNRKYTFIDMRLRRTGFIRSIILITLLTNSIVPLLVYSLYNEASYVEITPKIRIKGSGGGSRTSRTAATGIIGTRPPPEERRWAVIIGISDYDGEINDIEYADDDALDIAQCIDDYLQLQA